MNFNYKNNNNYFPFKKFKFMRKQGDDHINAMSRWSFLVEFFIRLLIILHKNLWLITQYLLVTDIKLVVDFDWLSVS